MYYHVVVVSSSSIALLHKSWRWTEHCAIVVCLVWSSPRHWSSTQSSHWWSNIGSRVVKTTRFFQPGNRVYLLSYSVHKRSTLSSSQSHAAITNYCRNGETVVRQWLHSSRTNEINNRDREIGPVQSSTVLSDLGRAGGICCSDGQI